MLYDPKWEHEFGGGARRQQIRELILDLLSDYQRSLRLGIGVSCFNLLNSVILGSILSFTFVILITAVTLYENKQVAYWEEHLKEYS